MYCIPSAILLRLVKDLNLCRALIFKIITIKHSINIDTTSAPKIVPITVAVMLIVAGIDVTELDVVTLIDTTEVCEIKGVVSVVFTSKNTTLF